MTVEVRRSGISDRISVRAHESWSDSEIVKKEWLETA